MLRQQGLGLACHHVIQLSPFFLSQDAGEAASGTCPFFFFALKINNLTFFHFIPYNGLQDHTDAHSHT